MFWVFGYLCVVCVNGSSEVAHGQPDRNNDMLLALPALSTATCLFPTVKTGCCRLGHTQTYPCSGDDEPESVTKPGRSVEPHHVAAAVRILQS